MNWLEEEFRKTEEEWAELPVWARPVYVPAEAATLSNSPRRTP